MPSIVNIGMFNSSTPQQNAGNFFGQINMTGWDANQKLTQAQGGFFGFMIVNTAILNNNFDALELMDGNIADQDIKAQVSGNL